MINMVKPYSRHVGHDPGVMQDCCMLCVCVCVGGVYVSIYQCPSVTSKLTLTLRSLKIGIGLALDTHSAMDSPYRRGKTTQSPASHRQAVGLHHRLMGAQERTANCEGDGACMCAFGMCLKSLC